MNPVRRLVEAMFQRNPGEREAKGAQLEVYESEVEYVKDKVKRALADKVRADARRADQRMAGR